MVLREPTGAGKTWASVVPFLYSLFSGDPIADRLLYVLPLRSLASSLHRTTVTHMRRAKDLFPAVSCSGKDRRYGGGTRYCSLQMGGEANDPFFESDLVFTTIDQLLSGYIGLPVSLPQRLGNMVAGALIGSFVVLDEVHLLEPTRAMGTMLEMLVRLRRLCQFVLMTATLSDEGVKWLASQLDAEPFSITDAEIRELPSQKTKQRTWRWIEDRLTAQEVRAVHRGGRTIALTNTVGRAQLLFKDLQVAFEGTPTKLVLLHSRYFPADRKAIEDQLSNYFGPQATLIDVVLVTTQVIEAGIDISADDLLTEVAPMNALVQRAGRVARYEHRNIGTISVLDVGSIRPYEDKSAVEATREILREAVGQNRVIDFAEEQSWIDRIHAEGETRAFGEYENLYRRRQQVHAAMEGDEAKLRDLVRDIDSVSVVLTDRPGDLNFSGRDSAGRRIGWPKMLCVPRTSLIALAPCFEGAVDGSWIAKGAKESEDGGPDLKFEWKIIESPKALLAQWMVVIHPSCASYDETVGLELGVSGPALAIEYAEIPRTPSYQYDFEPWVDHARRVRSQVQAMHQSHKRAAELLAGGSSSERAMIESIAELVCSLHDAGKLAVKWQEVAWRWQCDKDDRLRAQGKPIQERPQVPLAHTSFDPFADREYRGLLQYQFPNHAVEGAFAVEEALCTQLIGMWGEKRGLFAALAAVSAIARHHAPRARAAGRFELDEQARELLAAYLKQDKASLAIRQCNSSLASNEFADTLINLLQEEHAAAWPLYVFLVRRLRLADQGSLKDTKWNA